MRHIVIEHLTVAADWIAPVDNFNGMIGMEMLEWDHDLARIKLNIRPEHANGLGSVHGGVLMTLLDTVSGFAGVYTPEDEEPRGCATVALNVKFLKPAVAGQLIAEGRRQSGGKKTFFTYAEIRDEAGHLVATGDGTFHYRDVPKEILEKIHALVAATKG